MSSGTYGERKAAHAGNNVKKPACNRQGSAEAIVVKRRGEILRTWRRAEHYEQGGVIGTLMHCLRGGTFAPAEAYGISLERRSDGSGALSPLLANVYLDVLDKELERRGLNFVRYADDLLILVKSKEA